MISIILVQYFESYLMCTCTCSAPAQQCMLRVHTTGLLYRMYLNVGTQCVDGVLVVCEQQLLCIMNKHPVL